MGGRWAYRVPSEQPDGVGPLFPPVVLGVHAKGEVSPWTHHVPFWPKPVSIFGLLYVTAFSKRSPGLTVPSTLVPVRLMLADPLVPRGPNVSRMTAGPLSAGF